MSEEAKRTARERTLAMLNSDIPVGELRLMYAVEQSDDSFRKLARRMGWVKRCGSCARLVNTIGGDTVCLETLLIDIESTKPVAGRVLRMSPDAEACEKHEDQTDDR